MANKHKYTKELLEPLVKESKNWTELFKKLGIINGGGNYNHIKKHLIKHEISTDHFISKGEAIKRTTADKINLDLLFSLNSPYGRSTVKSYIYKLGLKLIKCELCGLGEEWQGKKISLILDHINGINNDHRLENLRLVCPNCNATLDTHCRGAKYMKGIEKPRKKTISLIEQKFETNKKLLLESDIDFTKHGWRLKAAELLGCTPQWVGSFIKQQIPELWGKCSKHVI
jgi:hypothetical protein